jgi:hypothetical protein
MLSAKKRISRADNSGYVLRSELLPGGGGSNPNESQSHIYLNLSIINGDTGDAKSAPVQCVFSESRQVPILNDASEYDLSVVRFAANGTGRLLPLWIPVIQKQQGVVTPPDPDLTIYSVTVYAPPPAAGQPAVASQQYMKWVTSNNGAPKPSVVNPQDLNSDYYYLRTFTAWSNMFNATLSAACVGAGLPALLYNEGISYNSQSKLFSLVLPQSFYPTPSGPAARPLLSVNTPMAVLLANFDWSAQAGAITDGQAYTLNTPVWGGTGAVPTITQDFQSTDDVWSPIDSFVFTTTFVPLLPEQGTAPVIVGSNNTGQDLGVGAGFTNVITDFVPDLSGGAQDGLSSQVYVPTSEYRISSMTTHQPIQQVDVTLWWRYRLTGTLVPLFMANLSSVTIKILFRRKDWGGKAY